MFEIANQEVWYTRCPVITGSGISIQNGMMENSLSEKGVKLRNLRNSHEPSTRESHFTHSLPRSLRQGGNAPALFAAASGSPTVLLGMQFIRQYQALLVAPESSIFDISQIKGKKVALPRRLNDKIDFWCSIALQGFLNTLEKSGISRNEVEWVDLPIERTYFHETPSGDSGQYVDSPRLLRQNKRELLALLRGEVDVIFGYSAWGALIRDQFELREIASIDYQEDLKYLVNNEFPATLTVSKDILDDSPEVVELYVSEILRAERWAQQNRQESISILARELGTGEFWVREGTIGNIHESFELSSSEKHIEALEIRKHFLLAEGFLPNDFDIRSWLNPDPLKNAVNFLSS